MTPAEVQAFQRSHFNHLGKPLRVDGAVGPQTEWALDFATLCRARREIVSAAQAYIGLAEDPPGSNGDPKGVIQAWLSRCWASPGDPWCAAFASWCITQGTRGSGAAACRQAGARLLGGMFPATTQPTAGDIFWYPTGAGRGHTGLVIGVSAFEVMTIEGNCANAVRCARRDRAGLQFARTVEDVSGTPPGVVPSVLPAPGGTR